MLWTCKKGRGGVRWVGGGESLGTTAVGKAEEEVEWVCDGGYELVGSGSEEHAVQDRQMWKAVITHLTPPWMGKYGCYN